MGLSLYQPHSDTLLSNSLYDHRPENTSLKDDDHDGVINARDHCEYTPLGAKIDNLGCPSTKTLLLSVELKVLFEFGKSDIKPRFYSEIKKLADFLRANPGSDAEINGHTDEIGSTSANLKLSQDRANAISSILINSFKIPAKQVIAIGHGETSPIADNSTPEGRAKNRRVVAEVFAKKVIVNERWNIYSVDKNIQ
ncbi:OmpA family protein [Marinomonas sp. C1424]|uniref:OmpA family protein n=2 Tax=Marinomonas transparens TaxID=2795388 RepID=A0A934JI74_9GAMM|nr:OmpA family protein [Marinomonas transparens]